MHPKYKTLEAELNKRLDLFKTEVRPLPGLKDAATQSSLVLQFVDSLRKIDRQVSFLRKEISTKVTDPHSDSFDPEKAAVLHHRSGNIDEAFWLVFLSVHFGRHKTHNWRLMQDIYGKLGANPYWSWDAISEDPTQFTTWLLSNNQLAADGVPRIFGNHRKYQSLLSPTKGTGVVLESYCSWIDSFGGHSEMVDHVSDQADGDPRKMFRLLYRSMTNVFGFGRLGKFDYLTLLGKLDIAPIEPDATYMQGATGPRDGARLLFTGNASARVASNELERLAIELESHLDVGMQAVEDALCNWQKSPHQYRKFRG